MIDNILGQFQELLLCTYTSDTEVESTILSSIAS